MFFRKGFQADKSRKSEAGCEICVLHAQYIRALGARNNFY